MSAGFSPALPPQKVRLSTIQRMESPSRMLSTRIADIAERSWGVTMFGQPQPYNHAVRNGERSRAPLDMSTAWERVIVLANRAPFSHERSRDGQVSLKRSASGLVTALEPIVEACSGVWVAHGAGNADAALAGDRGGLYVPPANPQYRLRYVWLTDREHRGYYHGCANEGFWPLCHSAHVQPVFRSSDFRMYQLANARFASAVCEEADGARSLVLVQDYHFALAPAILRERLPLSTVVAFWHIPWPSPRMFNVCPWGREVLTGLLGSDVVGFQTAEDCSNFLDTIEARLDADVDRRNNVVAFQGRLTEVHDYPVGIEWANPGIRAAPNASGCRERVCRELELPAGARLGVGIDRLDYTKGINEKFLAIERLLDAHPTLREHFVFVQIAEPSRECLPAYRAARARLVETAARVNGRFGTEAHRPIVVLEAHYDPIDVYEMYRAADFCYVASLHDGMNLVAKEFVAARDDERGVLVLSQFTGAAQQLGAALLVNPYAVDQSADVLAQALSMPDAEQSTRMRLMRHVVEKFDTYWWANRLLHDAQRVGDSSDRRPASDRVLAQPMSV
jgi:trehalose 6-phosphate synthase